jgi:hypothetical protein
MQQVRPKNRREFMNSLVIPTSPAEGNPNIIPSEPFNPGQPEFNRALEVSLKDDTSRNFKIGITDVNEAVQYYFENVLKLSAVQNNSKVALPIIYGSPEKWKSVQADGFYRDGASKIMPPLLMYRRTSIEQNKNLGNKIDGNNVHNVQLFKKGFSRRNIYDNFNILRDQVPQDEYVISITPDYVTVTYECVIWTNFVEQMDSIIEAVNYASYSYWGDPTRFQFLTKIDSFQDNLTYSTGEDRVVKTSFNMSINGYLIPDSVNAYISKLSERTYNLCKIQFDIEATHNG